MKAMNFKKIALGLGLLSFVLLQSCNTKQRTLKIYYNEDSTERKIPDFEFFNQDGKAVTQKDFENKIYVADFFFTTCPTICPIMKKEMLRVHERFKANPNIMILSHSIDPRHDSVEVLKEYAARLGVKSDKWHFVTGDRKKIYEIGEKSYMVTAQEDSTQQGGYLHSGAFILVDRKRRVRGLYDGTKEKDVNKLMEDIEILLDEK